MRMSKLVRNVVKLRNHTTALKHTPRTFVINALVHICQKEKIASEITAKLPRLPVEELIASRATNQIRAFAIVYQYDSTYTDMCYLHYIDVFIIYSCGHYYLRSET